MVRSANLSVLTIGHSTHTYDRFLELLRGAGITAVADVRSSPYSRRYPHFNKDELKFELRLDRIAFSFLGKDLGGRPTSRTLYCDGVADYEKMAKTDDFKQGLDRVIEGAKKYRIALMCSEHDPLDCHRCLLVSRALGEREVAVSHILASGQQVSQSEIENRLLDMVGRRDGDMFAPRDQSLAVAYRERARKVAYAEPKDGPLHQIAAE